MKGKTLSLYLAACFSLSAALTAPGYADQVTPSVAVKLDLPYVSKYVWRGTVPNPDPTLQPSLTLTHKSGVSLNLWASLDGTDINDEKGRPTEIDYTASYAWAAGKDGGIGMSAGLIDYTFPNTTFADTKEIYASAAFTGTLSPTLSVNYDYDEVDGYYISLGGSKTAPIGKNSMSLSGRLSFATAKYNKVYLGANKNAFTDLLLSASVPFTVGKSYTITPAVSYSTVLSSALRDGVTDPDNFFTSLTASFAF